MQLNDLGVRDFPWKELWGFQLFWKVGSAGLCLHREVLL